MTTTVTYNPLEREFYVGEHTLRDFYIKLRKDSGLSFSKLSATAGVDAKDLYRIEHPDNKAAKPHQRIPTILIGLEALGCTLDLVWTPDNKPS